MSSDVFYPNEYVKRTNENQNEIYPRIAQSPIIRKTYDYYNLTDNSYNLTPK